MYILNLPEGERREEEDGEGAALILIPSFSLHMFPLTRREEEKRIVNKRRMSVVKDGGMRKMD